MEFKSKVTEKFKSFVRKIMKRMQFPLDPGQTYRTRYKKNVMSWKYICGEGLFSGV